MSERQPRILQTKVRRVELVFTNGDGTTDRVDLEAAWRESGTVVFDEPTRDARVWEHTILRGEPARRFGEAVADALDAYAPGSVED